MLKELKREHRITYLTLDDGTADAEARERAEEYCDELVCVPHRTREKFSAGFYAELAQNLFSPLPYFMKKYESAEMREEIARRAAREDFDVLVCDFLQPGVNLPARVPLPTVLFQHNVEAMIWKRHYEVQQNPLKKIYLYGQWMKSKAYERASCRRFDHVVAVSAEDREQMRREYGVENVSDVPTGVDTEFFRRGRCGAADEINKTDNVADAGDATTPATGVGGTKVVARNGSRLNLVFTGSMDWLPNEDAIQYFTKEILPLIKREAPGATLTVVGRNPFPSLVELSERDSSVRVTGRVEDVRLYMEEAAVYVVPIRVGGGTRLKIYEAMAMELPVVSTTVGAEGLPVRDGAELLIADTPQAFADAVVRLFKDESLARELGARAAALVRERYGWGRVASSFAEACGEAIRAHEAKSGASELEADLRTTA